MQVFKTKFELRDHLDQYRTKNVPIGLVPTMGALHQGHLALVSRALEENGVVVVSIFVNPTQFNNAEDLANYPKPLQKDLSLLKEVSGELLVFTPEIDEIYPQALESKKYDFQGLDKVMEGAFRPGHFNGVGTIVEALFRTVEPHRAYFGEKDFQQLQIIRKLTQNEHIPVSVIGCPIVREASGLALSSRNTRLSDHSRQEASFIYEILQAAKSKFGTESAPNITAWVEEEFRRNNLLDLEYIQITDVDTLTPAKDKKENTKYRAFIAAYADGVRLIDNIALN
ncbi:pantoate--beta-alanine ligase [Zeaxanthinibacter sp. PT1]|uniref:pantoate--beta-alanine ligase n=1 Tax=Zeaxanthinibacter TaxID=561554 RepID=UPI00234922B3|nr:pantoate--beta-alanine ligase [Zeaxanthinibacter sp. PT1]MDC6351035.1 pantoate--beta-alanine ligase [Zeaxanthinibacter sp. PT1]